MAVCRRHAIRMSSDQMAHFVAHFLQHMQERIDKSWWRWFTACISLLGLFYLSFPLAAGTKRWIDAEPLTFESVSPDGTMRLVLSSTIGFSIDLDPPANILVVLYDVRTGATLGQAAARLREETHLGAIRFDWRDGEVVVRDFDRMRPSATLTVPFQQPPERTGGK